MGYSVFPGLQLVIDGTIYDCIDDFAVDFHPTKIPGWKNRSVLISVDEPF